MRDTIVPCLAQGECSDARGISYRTGDSEAGCEIFERVNGRTTAEFRVEERMSHDPDQIRGGRSFDRWEPERERWQGRVVHDGFDPEDDEELNDTLDDEDDTRSIVTAMPHSLERVDEDVAYILR